MLVSNFKKTKTILLSLLFTALLANLLTCPSAHEKQEEIIDTNAVKIAPNGRWIAFGSNSGNLWIIDLWQQPIRARLVDSLKGVAALSFTPDATYLLGGDFDSTLYLWRTGTWQRIDQSLKLPFKIVNTLAFHPFQPLAVCGNGPHEQPTLVFFEFAWFPFYALSSHQTYQVSGLFEYPLRLLFTPDGRNLIVEGYMGDLIYFPLNLKRNSTKSDLLARKKIIYDKESHGMTALSVSPDGRWLAFSPLDEERLLVYDFKNDSIVKTFATPLSPALTFTRDGQFLFMVIHDNQLAYLQAPDWRIVQTATLHGIEYASAIDHVPYTHWLLVTRGFNEFYLWDYEKKQMVWHHQFVKEP
jgi:WD40 repeat protein